MKKISTLLMLFCAFVGTALAQLPVASPAPVGGKWADGTKWYTIKRNKTNPIALSNADANGYLNLNSISVDGVDGYWCVVGNETDGYQFYNMQAGTTQTLGAYGLEANGRMKMYDLDVTTDGSNTLTKTFDIKKLDGQDGYAFVKNHGSTNAWWNERNGYLAYWNNDAAYSAGISGSQYTFEEVNVTTLLADYKTNAKAALDKLSALFSVDVADEKVAVDAVESNLYTFADIDAIVNSVAEAQYVSFRNSHTDVRVNHYLGADMTKGKGNGHTTFNHLLDVWNLKYDGSGAFYLYNVYNDVYLGTPSSNGVLTVTPTAGYTFEVVDGNKMKLKLDGQTLHLNNHAGNGPVVSTGYFLSSYDNLTEGEPASQWYMETENADYATAHKETALATLDSWKSLSVVFDGALVDAAKTAVTGFITTNYATIVAIDAELKKVTDDGATKFFTFKNTDTKTQARIDAYLAANVASTPKKGYGTKTFDYSAIWRLLSAGGTSFYLYNDLNGLYLKNPSSGELVENASDAGVYTFEFVDANTNTVELKCGTETLHLSNSCALMSYDENDPASRWIIAEYDLKAELQTLVTENASNHALVPALRQYPTEAYEALVAANETATSIAEISAAVAAFKASKNLPVFTISGTKDYVFGKSIYDNNSGSLYFKATNNYDKSMLWAFDQTTTTVGVTEKVVVTNVGTGKNFWGAPSVKITETKEAIADDGIFLLYTEGNGTTVHFQDANQIMVRYNSTEATSGSAMTFTYIGSTYELAQLTDEKWDALAELEALYKANKDAFVGEGLGQYTCDDDAWYHSFDVALKSAEGIVTNLSEKITTSLNAINDLNNILRQASTNMRINLPEAGKYYRFQGACEASLPGYYITGHTNGDGGRIALTKDADASTIYYFDGTNLIAYQSGLVVGLNASHWTFASVDDNSKPASVITFTGSPVKGGAYSIKSADRYFHYTVYNGTVQVNRCLEDIDAEHAWYITEVTELPVTISAAGYASFYAPVDVTLPTGVTAHTVTENGEWATLSDAISVVPAENGVILAGEAGTYNLAVSNTEAADLEGALAGTIAKTLVTKTEGDAYYMLGVVEGVVGLYNPVKGAENTKFYNAGHKAYWHIPATSQTAGFRFGGNTTAIESVLNNGVNANAPIYDLSGRRVNNAVKGGIYIKNGKKFIVK